MKRKIVVGIIFLAIAAVILLDALGTSLGFLDVGGLPIVRIVIGVALLAVGIKSTADGHVSGLVFPLAIDFLLFEDYIAKLAGKDDLLSTWTVLIVALLLTIGIEIIFGRKKRSFSFKSSAKLSGETKKNQMGNKTEYIDCTSFTEASYRNRLGELHIQFANPDSYAGGGTVYVENELGEIVVHVPAAWKIEEKIDNSLGDVVIPQSVESETVLTVTGRNRLGEVAIVRE